MIETLLNQHAELLLELGLHFLWQGTAIAILAWLVGLIVLRKPSQRSAVYLMALTAMPVAIAATFLIKDAKAPAPAVYSDAPVSTIQFSNADSQITEPGMMPVEAVRGTSSLSLWILGTYFVGLVVMMSRVVLGYRWSSRIRRGGEVVTEGNWSQALASAVKKMKVRATPAMIWSKNVSSPVITGFLRPMIVLPASLMSGLPMAQAVAVLSHELAHLRRFDHLIVFLQRLLEAVFFFHPAVWFLSRRLDQEREKACDDLVIARGNSPSDYAEALVVCASDQTATLALAAAQNSRIKERVLRILEQPSKTSVRVNRGGWLTIAVMILALGFVSFSPVHSEEKKEEGQLTMHQKLDVKIPVLDFNNATMEEAVEFLRIRSLELDPTPDPTKKGLNFVLRAHVDKEGGAPVVIDSLFARGFTFREALKAICMKTNMQFKIEQFAVAILPQELVKAGADQLITRQWKTPESFLEFITPKAAAGKEIPVAKLMRSLGIEFPEGASAAFIPGQQALTVRNTPKNLDLVDALVKSAIDPDAMNKERNAREEADEKIQKEIQKIIIPALDFTNTTLEEAVYFLRIRSIELDPSNKGVNINVFAGGKDLSKANVERLQLTNVPFPVALKYVCDLTKTRYVREGRNISILPIEK